MAVFDLVLDLSTSVEASLSSDGGTQALLELDVPGDVIEVKVWGQIDPTHPDNADFAEVEADAEWLPIAASFIVHLDPSNSEKTMHVRVRDDVHNEATDFALIWVGEAVGLPEPDRGPPRLTSPPEPSQHRVIESSTAFAVSTVAVVSRTAVGGTTQAVVTTTSDAAVVQREPPDRRVIPSEENRVWVATSNRTSRVHVSKMETWQLTGDTSVRKADGDDFETLVILGLI